jgi:rhamnogalacturonyl hydrolase YesR
MSLAIASAAAVGAAMVLGGISGCSAPRPPPRAGAPPGTVRSTMDPEAVKATIRRVADWQLKNPVPFDPRNWAMEPLYEGLISTSVATGDPRYLAAVVRAGLRVLWQPGPAIYHADDVADGQAWLRIYLMGPNNPALLEPFKERFDRILANPVRENLSFAQLPRTPGVEPTDRWTWSDALYMAPPALGRLYEATGDVRYLEFVDSEFTASYEALYDPRAKLFYRDARFIDRRTENGKKIFWSRGNGWVYAGLALLMNSLPADYPTRSFYASVFREMTSAILATQQPDGLWYPNLADPEQVPIGETSGSALFVFGLAWGVHHGLLDEATCWPAVERGWKALVGQIGPDGAVNSVQPIGYQPEPFSPDSHAPFGTGAVLGAGSEILRALGGDAKVPSATLLSQAQRLVGSVADLSSVGTKRAAPLATGADDRVYSVQVLTRIARPVLEALSAGELKKRMPHHDWERKRAPYAPYEAFARTLAGIAPWLELGPDETPEGRLRVRFIDLARKSLINATDPQSPDYMNFGQVPDQPLVESGYLASALLSAPHQLWEPLTASQRKKVLDALRVSLGIKLEHNNNWILFPAMIETVFWQFQEKADPRPIELAVETFQDWYVGDGTYGDGPEFHWDYYNSYDIQPMLLQILRVAAAKGHPIAKYLPVTHARARRYAVLLERLVSPEGTFPVMGRSSAYRFAALYHLAFMALHDDLPDSLERGAVRGAITAVIRNMIEARGTFDENGWLNLGAVGSQPGLREDYNSSGSPYLCLMGLVHLGLPAEDRFWTTPAGSWTQRRIWNGQDVPRDHALQAPTPEGSKISKLRR